MPVLCNSYDAPLVGDDRGSQAEGDHVRKAVVFLTECGLRLRQPGNTPVQRVEDHCDEHRHARGSEVLVDCSDDGVEPGEQTPRSEQIGQQIDALPPGFQPLRRRFGFGVRLHRPLWRIRAAAAY